MGINLTKGQKISLTKNNGTSLNNFCVGANWGVIEKKGFFRTKKIPVDLDLSAVVFNYNKELIDIVYFGNLETYGIRHSGDDLIGDINGDDGLDNEIIEVSLSNLLPEVNEIFFVLNSYNGQDFSIIPFASIRLYEGTPFRVDNVVASYNVAQDYRFAGYVSMILGKLYKKNGNWKFSAMGIPTRDRKLDTLILNIIQNYL
jgi:tellurium resistance protein TerZ